MSIFISAHKRRSSDHQITILSNGEVAVFGAGDTFRVKIGRLGMTPVMDIASSGLAASTLTPANPSTLALAGADLDLIEPGIYEIEAGIVDVSDSSRFKHADTGVFVLHDTPLGGTGL